MNKSRMLIFPSQFMLAFGFQFGLAGVEPNAWMTSIKSFELTVLSPLMSPGMETITVPSSRSLSRVLFSPGIGVAEALMVYVPLAKSVVFHVKVTTWFLLEMVMFLV